MPRGRTSQIPSSGMLLEGIPDDEYQSYQDWLKARRNAEPGEMICNRWLDRSEVGFLAVWGKDRRELNTQRAADLPAMLVYRCLHFADRLCYCKNPKCSVLWFIGRRRDQQYCSNDCAWPRPAFWENRGLATGQPRWLHWKRRYWSLIQSDVWYPLQ